MFGIKYIKVPPTTYVQQYKAGRVKREGAELKEQTQVAWNANYLYYSVREPFPSKHSSTNSVFGKITVDQPMRVVSHMPQKWIIFSDGIEKDFLDFNSGMEATISLAKKKGLLVV